MFLIRVISSLRVAVSLLECGIEIVRIDYVIARFSGVQARRYEFAVVVVGVLAHARCGNGEISE